MTLLSWSKRVSWKLRPRNLRPNIIRPWKLRPGSPFAIPTANQIDIFSFSFPHSLSRQPSSDRGAHGLWAQDRGLHDVITPPQQSISRADSAGVFYSPGIWNNDIKHGCLHTIIHAVPAPIFQRSYPTGYAVSCDHVSRHTRMPECK